MNTIERNHMIQTKKRLHEHQLLDTEGLPYFLSLCHLTQQDSAKAMELLLEEEYPITHITKAERWEEVLEAITSYLEVSMELEGNIDGLSYQEKKKQLKDIQNYNPSSIGVYFTTAMNFYLFPDMGVAFSVPSKTMEKFHLPQPGIFL
ncbi:hypothetical protein [Rossellomorea marisflavi]|uniref:hypothetical protein n=1 Tax=Rossellomorea marisflavi TaxID=189381 RepID=UPI003F9F4093